MSADCCASLEECWLEIVAEHGMPDVLLACTYAFQAEFLERLLQRFAEVATTAGHSVPGMQPRNPVDVVCDRHRYLGHKMGFNVHFWNRDGRLFHPKLLIGLFGGRLVWSSGSLNLTRAGGVRNRELANFHTPARLVLPRALRALLRDLPENVSAARILESTRDAPDRLGSSTFLTSSSDPIGPRFLRGLPRHARAIHLIAPYFDRKESGEGALGANWLQELHRRCPKAEMHIYLPLLNEDSLRVQGDERVFTSLAKQMHKVGLAVTCHPVPPAPGPLHAKLVCVEYVTRGGNRARILTGSPNMTAAGLLDRNGNIETAWISDQPWHATQPLLDHLRAEAHPVRDLEFEAPQIVAERVWMPLRSVLYDPMRRVLELQWLHWADAAMTSLHYGGREIRAVDGRSVTNFDLVDGLCWVETRNRSKGWGPGRVPIEIPFDVSPACEGGAPPRTPEDWLRLLGSSGSDVIGDPVRLSRSGDSGHALAAESLAFSYSEKVRDLAARMRFLKRAVVDAAGAEIHQRWLLKLFDSIYDSHTLAGAESVEQRTWRAWVRVELWQAAQEVARQLKRGAFSDEWQARARRLRRMRLRGLPPFVRKQCDVLLRTLRREGP